MLLNLIGRKFGSLVGKGLPWSVIGEVFLLSVPFLLAMTLPLAVLAATLYAFGQLANDSEITAMRAGGVSTMGMLRPVLAWAVVMVLVTFGFVDQVLPRSNARLRNLYFDIAKKKPTFSMVENVINKVPSSQYFLRASRIDPGSGTAAQRVHLRRRTGRAPAHHLCGQRPHGLHPGRPRPRAEAVPRIGAAGDLCRPAAVRAYHVQHAGNCLQGRLRPTGAQRGSVGPRRTGNDDLRAHGGGGQLPQGNTRREGPARGTDPFRPAGPARTTPGSCPRPAGDGKSGTLPGRLLRPFCGGSGSRREGDGEAGTERTGGGHAGPDRQPRPRPRHPPPPAPPGSATSPPSLRSRNGNGTPTAGPTATGSRSSRSGRSASRRSRSC